ncbi:MarR family winged helix-turn-helix transcriptional regulator [Brachybacterium sp. YJGR34]|uniref:MarR family winged helix-turn-helix transcriptional regulator n=1 Tax=Brachybacterium sp. YJGR34 TaxID=2059911 RepID=UPI0018E60221|nr:MarR family winged helix-turn-helix transcriptional regulator [Brachybacterium sp. YJGR34]
MDRRRGADRAPELAQGRRIAGMFSRLERSQRHHEATMTLGVADLRILWLFTDGRARTLREIAAELHLEQSTVNRQVNAAVDEGLLERSGEKRGAARLVTSTPAGREAFERDVAISLGAYEAALTTMGADRAALLLELMEEFLAAYGGLLDGAPDR